MLADWFVLFSAHSLYLTISLACLVSVTSAPVSAAKTYVDYIRTIRPIIILQPAATLFVQGYRPRMVITKCRMFTSIPRLLALPP